MRANKPVFLDGLNPRADQEVLLEFVAHKALNSCHEHSTTHGILVAMWFNRLMAGFTEPLEDNPLVEIEV